MRYRLWLGIATAIVMLVGVLAQTGVATAAAANAPTPGGALTHSEATSAGGQPIKNAPHPYPIPVGAKDAPAVTGHWYDGIVWNPSYAETTSTVVQTEIQVPSAVPASNNTDTFYYELLSIWDNNGSYDQIGFTEDGGVWGLTYSYTYGLDADTCTGTLHYEYNPDTLNLNPGAYYTFTMDDRSDGYVEFIVQQGLNFIYDDLFYTGGTEFINDYSFCGYLDVTDFQEVYEAEQSMSLGGTTYPIPDFPFHYVGGFADGITMKQMGFIFGPGCGSGGGGSGCMVNTVTAEGLGGRALLIGNEPFSVNFYATFPMFQELPAATTAAGYNYSLDVGVTAIGTTHQVDECYSTTGAGMYTDGWGEATPSFIATLIIHITKSDTLGYYTVTIYAFAGPNDMGCTGPYTYITQELFIE